MEEGNHHICDTQQYICDVFETGKCDNRHCYHAEPHACEPSCFSGLCRYKSSNTACVQCGGGERQWT